MLDGAKVILVGSIGETIKCSAKLQHFYFNKSNFQRQIVNLTYSMHVCVGICICTGIFTCNYSLALPIEMAENQRPT